MTNKLCFWHNKEKCESCLLILSNLYHPPDYDTIIHITHAHVKEWTTYLHSVKELKNKIQFETYKKQLEKFIKGE